MKLLFDENLSPRLVGALADVYPASIHVHQCELGSTDDAAIWLPVYVSPLKSCPAILQHPNNLLLDFNLDLLGLFSASLTPFPSVT